MDGERLTLAVIKTKSAGGESRVYVYRDGDQWKDDKEGDHKNKLTALKERCKPGETLDISKREDTDIGSYYSTCPDSGEIDHSFTFPSARVTKVVEGDYIIWRATADTDQKCTHAQIAVVGDRETLTLTIQSDRERVIKFRKEGRRWQRV
ncbi:hypothetical protein BEWA_023160 [Theileria equi strain WA]|uniref:Signal peptide containing protein n=1 Tax=Theileria equi strain WA TaxID=1537102 RepID=L0AV34_THEEQ|nr:hypothetical protein BEWA_023160 [Theileria equi strain WA]AFZ79467.1 hypothetical protein BEWA_023160 [Theileria equi strain WA]|eukprot:XP_004829133.1 hypothetical protein BEWA_023160 [Theileria equi strain WA]